MTKLLRVDILVPDVIGGRDIDRSGRRSCLQGRQVPEASDSLDDHCDSDDDHRGPDSRERIYKRQDTHRDRKDTNKQRYPPQTSYVPDDKYRLEHMINTDYKDHYAEDYVEQIKK